MAEGRELKTEQFRQQIINIWLANKLLFWFLFLKRVTDWQFWFIQIYEKEWFCWALSHLMWKSWPTCSNRENHYWQCVRGTRSTKERRMLSNERRDNSKTSKPVKNLETCLTGKMLICRCCSWTLYMKRSLRDCTVRRKEWSCSCCTFW